MSERLCAVPGCVRRSHARYLLCSMHYSRKRATGEVGPAGPLVNTGSGRCIGSNGYMRLHRPGHPLADGNGYVYEHRLVAYGAGLLPDEPGRLHVHHINGNRLDNRVENLAVLTPEEHGEEHRRTDHAEVVALYLSGKTVIEIGLIVGIDNSGVSRILASEGVPTRPNKTKVDEDLIAAMLSFGVPMKAVMRTLGVGASTARRVRDERQIPRRRVGKGPVPPPTPEEFYANCHRFVHGNPTEAYERGWLLRHGSPT